MSKNKIYAVKAGREPGIYQSWADCKKQVEGYSGAIYKSFETLKEAEAFLNPTVFSQIHNTISKPHSEIDVYVDGSFSESKQMYSYGCIIIKNKEVIEKLNGIGKSPDHIDMRNVAGELLGAMVAIKWAANNGYKSVAIFHDYEGIARWANEEWKANKEGTQKYVEFIKKYRSLINISFEKVKGHSGNIYNDLADNLAKEAIEQNNIGNPNPNNDLNNADYKLFWDCIRKKIKSKAKIRISHYIDGIEISDKNIENFIYEHWNNLGKPQNEIISVHAEIDICKRTLQWKISTSLDNQEFLLNF